MEAVYVIFERELLSLYIRTYVSHIYVTTYVQAKYPVIELKV